MSVDSGRVPDGTGLSQAEPASRLGPSGFDPSRDDYSTLDMADLHYAARVLEELAAEVAQSGAGRQVAERVDLGAQAVRLAIEVLDDLHRSVRARDSDGSPKGGDAEGGSVRSTTARAEGIAQGEQP